MMTEAVRTSGSVPGPDGVPTGRTRFRPADGPRRTGVYPSGEAGAMWAELLSDATEVPPDDQTLSATGIAAGRSGAVDWRGDGRGERPGESSAAMMPTAEKAAPTQMAW